MKNLYVLRHASTNLHSPTGKDFDREINSVGLQQIDTINIFLENYTFSCPTKLFVSTAKRTTQTYQGIKKHIENKQNIEHPIFLDDLYLADFSFLANFVWNQSFEEDIFILGHNNGISELVSYFTEKTIILSTCEFIHLQFDCTTWKEVSKGLGDIIKF